MGNTGAPDFIFPQISLANGNAVFNSSGIATEYGGVATVSNGLAGILAKNDQTAVTANISTQTIYAVPSGGAGTYHVSLYAIVTQVASGGSPNSTLPSQCVTWTDADNNAGQIFELGAESGNTLTTNNFGNVYVHAKASTNIQIATGTNCAEGTTYASSGTQQMQYAFHAKVEYLGP